MTWIHVAWLAFGVVLGAAHAAGIWRSSVRPTPASAIFGVVRLMVVGFLLVPAAIFGGILPAAGGWFGGFFARVGVAVSVSSRAGVGAGSAPL